MDSHEHALAGPRYAFVQQIVDPNFIVAVIENDIPASPCSNQRCARPPLLSADVDMVQVASCDSFSRSSTDSSSSGISIVAGRVGDVDGVRLISRSRRAMCCGRASCGAREGRNESGWRFVGTQEDS